MCCHQGPRKSPLAFASIGGAGLLYFHNQHLEKLQSALWGAAAAGAGMTISMGLKMAGRQSYRVGTALITVATFVAIGLLRYPLMPVLAVMATISIYMCRARAKTSAGKEGRESNGQ